MDFYQKYLRDEESFSNRINMIPFMDIILVLLIVFMIAAPALNQSGMNIELPKSKNDDRRDTSPMILYLNREEEIFLNQKKINLLELSKALKIFSLKKTDPKLTINADRKISHGKVIEIIDIVREQGIKKIYVGTQKR